MPPTNKSYPFERPVILLAAPRSGSTLLFETLGQSSDFWTIGGESHGFFESIDRFNPAKGICDSNALFAHDATPAIVNQIRLWFYQQLRDSTGRRYAGPTQNNGRPRLLEKTPKNSLRVSLLNEIFPDALFIYLYRNPRENISSIMDAWQSGRFVTYKQLAGRPKPWSLLLPPGWQSFHHASVEETAAFQWRSANTAILTDLAKLSPDRWMATSYGQQVQQPEQTLQNICDFCGVSAERIIDYLAGGQSKLSRYTLSAPAADKWHKNAQALNRVIPSLSDTIDYIRKMAPQLPENEFDMSLDEALGSDAVTQSQPAVGVNSTSANSRNARCHCGSGKRFKHCHGERS